MQRGIDSFFKRVGKSEKTEEDDDIIKKTKKRKKIIISSDEDEVAESPEKTSIHKKTRPNDVQPSPKTGKNVTPKKKSPKVVTKVDPKALFGGETKRVVAPKPPKPKTLDVIQLEDEDIDKSLMEIDIDEEILTTTKEHRNSPRKHKEATPKKSPQKLNGDSIKTEKPSVEKLGRSSPRKGAQKRTPSKQKEAEEVPQKVSKQTPAKQKSPVKVEKLNSSVEKKPSQTPKSETPKAKTPRVKKEHKDELNESVVTDEERHERKRMAAALYQKFKNRSSCLNPGSKEVPKGAPNCLAGSTFLVTGVLESLERDEANSIIKEYGGKISTVVGKRLNYLIVGEDSGPKKLAQAEEFGITVLSEDGLFDLIRERSGEKPKKEEKIEKQEKETSSKEKKIKKEQITPPKVETVKKEIKTENNNNFKETKVKIEIEKVENVKEVDDDMIAWVDKYKPTSVKEIIGQQGAASNVVKLTNWLSKWYTNHDGKKKLQKPNPWAKNDDGSFYKAALLSGPPGIGKTTTATLVCRELGFDIVEFNASDTRSKRLLKEEVSELLTNKSLYGFCHGNENAVTKKHVLIMDEVDGMAGNEDRGGIQELIGLIKDSSVPIICMCNDRNHQKMRSLVNYCYDLRFPRPRLEQIKGRLMSILCREKIKIESSKLEELISASNNDIRQSINHIAMLSANKDLDLNDGEREKIAEKDLKMGPWDVVRKVFSEDEHKKMSIYDKCDLFFHDYSLAPLFVQQNYLQVSPHGPKNQVLRKIARTADALSLGDLVDKRIRSRMAWSLLPVQAVFSSYMPGEFMCGHFTGQINFPGWLGKNSRSTKRSRLAQEIHDHTRLRTSGSRLSVRLDYAPFLLDKIVRPLKELGMEGVETALNVMKEYHLLREDIDALLELTSWSGKKQDFDAVDGRVKAALTRTYNKKVLAYSYSATAGVKKKRAEALDDDELVGMADSETAAALAVDDSDAEKDDDLALDGLIKAKTKKATAAAPKAKAATAGKKSGAKEGGKAKGSTARGKK